MAQSTYGLIPEELADWICRQQGCAGASCQRCRRTVEGEVYTLAGRLGGQVSRGELANGDSRIQPYAGRIWTCCHYHWKRLGEPQPVLFAQLTQRLEEGDLGYERASSNVLLEVALAQALEANESKAALMFESQYMPYVIAIARRVGGPRAVDAFENFVADLILPREKSPPRIAGYQGRTSLRSWLRAVVANLWVSRQRKKEAQSLGVLPETGAAPDPAAAADHQPCAQLLQPLLSEVIGRLNSEDRLLIKMLLLDEVPQKQLADCLGIHSGNLTRRKQRIAGGIWQGVQQLAQTTGRPQRVEECLQLALAGPDRELKQRLGQVLSQALTASAGTEELA